MPPVHELTELVAAEIRSLRKGRGMQAVDLDRHLGQALRELAVGHRGDDMASRRQVLAAELGACAARLPGDLQVAITASLAMSAQTRQMPYFKDRASWLAAQIGYEYRTALRRIDIAERRLAEEVALELVRRRGRTAAMPDGWYLEEFRTLLRLDTATPEAHERRRIVATRSGLTEVVAWLDVPPSPGHPGPALAAEVHFGGRLIRRKQPSQNRFEFVVQLPAPLQAGQKHEYGLILRVPEGGQMRPHYIFTPECRCDLFELRVRFDLEHPPGWVRRVQGETVRTFDAEPPGGDLVALDDAGELQLQFRNPTMYLGYGAQWRQQD